MLVRCERNHGLLPIKEVTPQEYLKSSFNEPIFTHLEVEDYFDKIDGGTFIRKEFYTKPELFKQGFQKYVPISICISLVIIGIVILKILKQEDLASEDNRISVVADISCDIADPIASTLRPSKISNPIYGYNPKNGQEVEDYKKKVLLR